MDVIVLSVYNKNKYKYCIMKPSIIELTDIEIDIIIKLANRLDISPSKEPELFCKLSKELSNLIPERIRNFLIDFSKMGSDTGYLLIRGIPIDDTSLPTTPSGNNKKIGEKTILSRIQSIFCNIIGEMIAYEAEGYGRLFQDIVPTQSMSNEQTSLGSSIELEIHTEQAFSKLRPDILSLACLRGDKSAMTYILPVQYILDNISEKQRDMVREPLWTTSVDLSFKLYGNDFIEGDIRGPFSIIYGEKHDPKLRFDQDLMRGITDESDELIKRIVDIYYETRLSHNLQPGDILLLDNHRAVHGRSPFFPRYDGYDRFLIRCFITYNYEYSSYARANGQRVVGAIYS